MKHNIITYLPLSYSALSDKRSAPIAHVAAKRNDTNRSFLRLNLFISNEIKNIKIHTSDHLLSSKSVSFYISLNKIDLQFNCTVDCTPIAIKEESSPWSTANKRIHDVISVIMNEDPLILWGNLQVIYCKLLKAFYSKLLPLKSIARKPANLTKNYILRNLGRLVIILSGNGRIYPNMWNKTPCAYRNISTIT